MPCNSKKFHPKLFSEFFLLKVTVLQGTNCVLLVFLTFMLDNKFGKTNCQDTKCAKRFRYTCFNWGFEKLLPFQTKRQYVPNVTFTNFLYLLSSLLQYKYYQHRIIGFRNAVTMMKFFRKRRFCETNLKSGLTLYCRCEQSTLKLDC